MRVFKLSEMEIAKVALVKFPANRRRFLLMKNEELEPVSKPGLDETENEFRYRLKEPDAYSTCRRKAIQEESPKVDAVFCQRKDNADTWEIQALRFPKSEGWTKDKAQSWVDSHKDIGKQGQGQGDERNQTGGTDTCVCPKCGWETEHERGTPCNQLKCEKCGAVMTGKGTAGSTETKTRKSRILLSRKGGEKMSDEVLKTVSEDELTPILTALSKATAELTEMLSVSEDKDKKGDGEDKGKETEVEKKSVSISAANKTKIEAVIDALKKAATALSELLSGSEGGQKKEPPDSEKKEEAKKGEGLDPKVQAEIDALVQKAQGLVTADKLEELLKKTAEEIKKALTEK
jgi:hypothetical protein